MGRPRIDAVDRFLAMVDRRADDECWPWLGYRLERGYGKFRDGSGRLVFAHRFAYTQFVGEIGEGLVVMHSCDNPPCVNPRHLSVGTMANNIADRDAKGRGIFPGPKRRERTG